MFLNLSLNCFTCVTKLKLESAVFQRPTPSEQQLFIAGHWSKQKNNELCMIYTLTPPLIQLNRYFSIIIK